MARPKTYLKKISFNRAEVKEKPAPPVVPLIREILDCKTRASATMLALEAVTADCLTLQCSLEEFISSGYETPHFKTVALLLPGKYESCDRYVKRIRQAAPVIWPKLQPLQHFELLNILDHFTDQQMKLMKQYVLVYKQLLKVVRF